MAREVENPTITHIRKIIRILDLYPRCQLEHSENGIDINPINRMVLLSIDCMLDFFAGTNKYRSVLPSSSRLSNKKDDYFDFVLQLEKNTYGINQVATNWYQMPKEGLFNKGFKSSKINPHLFLTHHTIIMTYIDYCFIFSKNLDKTKE